MESDKTDQAFGFMIQCTRSEFLVPWRKFGKTMHLLGDKNDAAVKTRDLA